MNDTYADSWQPLETAKIVDLQGARQRQTLKP